MNRKYSVGEIVGPNTVLGFEVSREPCAPHSGGWQNGKRTRKYTRYRVLYKVMCLHGIRTIRCEDIKKGCAKCASASSKTKGLPWNVKPFYQLIWQPKWCLDCDQYFETLFPTQKRCKDCQQLYAHMMRRVSHKCRHLGVPYDAGIGPMFVFRRDRWICWICGLETPQELRGTFDDFAPEVEHKIELTESGSPGHVASNVACAHRKCNQDKQLKRGKRQNWYQKAL